MMDYGSGAGIGALREAGMRPARDSGKRARVVAVFMAAIFGLTAVKGASLSLSGGTTSAAEAMPALFPVVGNRRADIVDRNGELLATTVDATSLFADPRAIWNVADTASRLAAVLDGVDEARLAERLADRDRAFVWVKRHLTPRQHAAVFDLGLEGIGFRQEPRRAYPKGDLAGHIIGYTSIDGEGLAGAERLGNDGLLSSETPLMLTIDAGVQFALETELDAAATRLGAIGGAGVIVQVKTGEIRAMASWPSFNPNRAGRYVEDDPARFNRATTGVYELGSVFKPLTVAAALSRGAIAADDVFNTADPIVFGDTAIKDLHPVPSPASVTRILADSSNIGTVRIAQAMGGDRHISTLADFGLTRKPAGRIPGVSAPLLPERWTPLTAATVSYGHGLAVSPLSMTAAYAALGNRGVRHEVKIFDDRPSGAGEPPPKVPTIAVSRDASEAVIEMLRSAVLDGTGRAADVPGYRVAGKTGTAEKPIDGVYDPNRNLNSFAAVFPADRPEYAILVMLDEPNSPPEVHQETSGGVARTVVGDTAASTAAPLAGRIIERVAPLLGVMPRWDDPANGPANAGRQSE
ncbi:MAG: penicillin-binding protein 2 [Pseudomonadota bacterium]